MNNNNYIEVVYVNKPKPPHDGTIPYYTQEALDSLKLNHKYKGQIVFYLDTTDGKKPIDWKENMITLENLPETEWFPTKLFITIDEWRQQQLNKLIE
jgi:hypothetical protein